MLLIAFVLIACKRSSEIYIDIICAVLIILSITGLVYCIPNIAIEQCDTEKKIHSKQIEYESLIKQCRIISSEYEDVSKASGTCPSYAVRTATKHDTSKGSCCPVAIGNALIDMYKEMQDEISDDLEEIIDTPKQPKKKIIVDKSKTAKCPQCGGNLVFEGGCNTCKDCGWSKCD